MTMRLYRLITGPDDSAFCHRVSAALNQGWQLSGSPALTFNGTEVIAAQAVYKEVAGDYHAGINLG